MGGLAEWEGCSPTEMKKMTTDLLKKKSPELLDSLFTFYYDNISGDDPVKMKLAIEIGKTLINKALPNQTKVEVENNVKIPREFLQWKEEKRKELENKHVTDADYSVED